MLSDNINYFRSKPINIPKITILLDNGYHPEKIIQELEKIYPAIMTKIRFKLSPKLTNIRIDKKHTQATDTTTLQKRLLGQKRRARRIRTPPDWVHGET